jgi:ATP-dependent Lon protease
MTEFSDEALILLPVCKVVLFPGLILPIVLGRGASIAAAQEVVRRERPLGVILQKRPDVGPGSGGPVPGRYYRQHPPLRHGAG